uniref:interleukin-13 receptor subunit alpha-1 n=1 Tax=Semicossyphus pulcher TaxID=241346 RepID=UPI0037E77CD8
METFKKISRILQSLDLMVIFSLFLLVESLTGQILPPQNLSLLWPSDFYPRLSWSPPPHSMENCTYEVKTITNEMYGDKIHPYHTGTHWTSFIFMEGGFLQVSVETVCGGTKSEPVTINTSYPELVTDLDCCIHSSKQTNCTWRNARDTPDLRFFYRLLNEDFSESAGIKYPPPAVKECSLYKFQGDVKNGCSLKAKIPQSILVLVNGTVNNKLVRNTFRKTLKCVRLPALDWNVTKTKDNFIINWMPPDIINLSEWKFTIEYHECNKIKKKFVDGKTTEKLDRLSHCSYKMTIQGTTGDNGKTELSEAVYFDADPDQPNALVYAAIIIPLMFVCLAAFAFVCCRKNKENIFPKIPVPRDLLSDISDNNNKSTVHNLYVPAEEEENCKITLVMDPQTDKLLTKQPLLLN